MTGRAQRRVVVRASTSDAYDGLVRLLVDAQRFGFALVELSSSRQDDGRTAIRMVIETEGVSDCAEIGFRLARHPALAAVEAFEFGDEPGSFYVGSLHAGRQGALAGVRA